MKILMIVLIHFLCKDFIINNFILKYLFIDYLDIKAKVQVDQMKLEMKIVFMQNLRLIFSNIHTS